MIFTADKAIPKLPFEVPDDIPIYEFVLGEKHGRRPINDSFPTFTDGVTGESRKANELQEHVELLARSLSERLGWRVEDTPAANVNQDRPPEPDSNLLGEKVLCVYSYNTIDFLTVSWAAHRLNAVSSPANASYSASELAYQIKDSGSKALFTNAALLPIALDAAKRCGLSKERIFLIELPPGPWQDDRVSSDGYKTVQDLIEEGRSLPELSPLRWNKGQGFYQVAFLCYSSGTSGLPKGVMIQHHSMITNVLQMVAHKAPERQHSQKQIGDSRVKSMAFLPLSHIYGLVVVAHQSIYVGDEVVCLPKFEFTAFLQAISDHKINDLYVVPPVVILMTKNKKKCDMYDLGSVRNVFSGAAPLGLETAEELSRLWPKWNIRQAYGMTESGPVICLTTYDDVEFGSSGSILQAYEVRLINEKGADVDKYEEEGEIVVRSTAVVLGYLNRPEANKETFQNGWLHTGDKGVIRKSPKGVEHLWIVDRMKELIKVNGLQVAPAELEACILSHEAVADVAVISVPHEQAGEAPKAYVVKASSVGLEENDKMVIRSIKKHVEKEKAKHKWLRGGVEFIDEIPKSPSGKILRRILRDKDKGARRKAGSKL